MPPSRMSRAVMVPSLMSLPVMNFAAVALPPPTTVATMAAARIDRFIESSLALFLRGLSGVWPLPWVAHSAAAMSGGRSAMRPERPPLPHLWDESVRRRTARSRLVRSRSAQDRQGEGHMQVWIRVNVAIVAAATVVLLGAAPALGADIGLRLLSNRADLVSGDDALVEATPPAGTSPSDLTVDVDGRDVTAAFSADGARLLGNVEGLHLVRNVLTARTPNGVTARLAIADPAIGGPIIAGEQVQPWLCTTDTNSLGKAADSQCNAPTKVAYFYKSTDASKNGLQPYDPAAPPSDVAQTT